MAKQDKREAAIRRNPKAVRFPDLDSVLRTYGFDGNTNRPHVVYQHKEYGDLRVNVPKPHEGEKHVKPVYVVDVLAAIDEAARRDAEKEQ